MPGIYDWRKQFYAVNGMTDILNSFSIQMDAVNRFEDMPSTLKAFSGQGNALSSMNAVQLTPGDWIKPFEMYLTFQEVDFSKIFVAQELVDKMKANFDFPAVYSALDHFTKLNASAAAVHMSSALKVYDSFKFTHSVQNTFSSLDWSKPIHISDILEEVTEQYIRDNKLEKAASKEIREVAAAKDGTLLTERQRKIWEVYIFPFLVSLFFFILSSSQPQQTATDSITEVNHFYTVEVGMDVNALNDYNFRMICKDDVMPRVHPDCSSRVVARLPIGKVVCVVDRYKKWIEITWKNDDGEYFSGWIQNYKVAEFR